MKAVTDYLDTPLTQALCQRYGNRLEQLSAVDKLDLAQAILTAIAYGDNSGQAQTIATTIEQFGAVYPDAPNTDDVTRMIDAHGVSIEERFGLAAVLCHHLQAGVYADAQ